MSLAMRHVIRAHKALLAARQMPRLCTPVSTSVVRSFPTTLNDGASKTHDHSLHFKIERYFAAAMVPLFPAAYFIHGPVMDAVLTVALVLHVHWSVIACLIVIAGFLLAFSLSYGKASADVGNLLFMLTTANLGFTGMINLRTMHGTWTSQYLRGVQGVIQDYARPFVIGDFLAKAARAGVYVITIAILAGLLHFNTNDVGLTKAFEMVFAL